MKKPFQMISLFLLLFAAGCVDPYAYYYRSNVEAWPQPALTRIIHCDGPATLVSSNNMKADAHTLLQSGFILLGRSKFKSTLMDENEALNQAQTIGACLVLVDQKYDKTITLQVPDVVTTAPQPFIHTRAVVGAAGQTHIVTRTGEIPGSTQVDWEPEEMDYYKYSATFWAQARPSLSGMLVKTIKVSPLNPPSTEPGLYVDVIVTNSPAFNAGLQEGDILTNIAGVDLRSIQQFYDVLRQNAGKTVDVLFDRNGTNMQASITLNPAS